MTKEVHQMEVKSHMHGDRMMCEAGVLAGLIIIATILDLFGFLFLLTSKNPVFFIGIGFTVVFAIWFGWKGILAAYLGCLLSGLLALPLTPEWLLLFAVADAVQVAIPVLVFHLTGADPALTSVKDVILFVFFGCIINTIVSGLLGTYILSTTGIVPSGQFVPFFEMWMVGDMMAIFLISTIILSFGTPYMREKGWIH